MSTKAMDFSGLDSFSQLLKQPTTSIDEKGNGALTHITPEADTEGAELVYWIPLDLIDEDPNQPRKEFSEEAIESLAADIQEKRRNTSPVSVRPADNGRFILNFGARRYRATKRTDLGKIRATIDRDINDYDQVNENELREGLTPLELAMFVQKRIKAGDKKGEVAKRLKKPNSYVSDYLAFLDLPDSIRALYDSKIISSVHALADLYRFRKEYEEDAEELVEWWARAGNEVGRGTVQARIAQIKAEKEEEKKWEAEQQERLVKQQAMLAEQGADKEDIDQDEDDDSQRLGGQHSVMDSVGSSGGEVAALDDDEDYSSFKKSIIQVQYDERPARLIQTKRATYGFGWIKYDEDGHEVEVPLQKVQLIAVIEA